MVMVVITGIIIVIILLIRVKIKATDAKELKTYSLRALKLHVESLTRLLDRWKTVPP